MIRWLASSHPKINHSAWTSDETAKVKNLVGDMEDGEVDWEVVAKQLGVGRLVPLTPRLLTHNRPGVTR
jgi:hypothetical protein